MHYGHERLWPQHFMHQTPFTETSIFLHHSSLSSFLKLAAKDVLPNINCTRAAEIDLNLQTHLSEGPNMSSAWICCISIQQFLRYLLKTPFFCLSDLDLWPWHSNLTEQGTKHVFTVNMAQVRSAVSEIFHTQTKKSHTVPKTEPYAVHCVR